MADRTRGLGALLVGAVLAFGWVTAAAAQNSKAWNDLAAAQTEGNRQPGVRQVPAHALPLPKVLQVFEGQSHAQYYADPTGPETIEYHTEVARFFDDHLMLMSQIRA